MEKNRLTKILALGATSAALLGGALLTNNNVQASSNSVTLLTFKHNAYKYNRSGKRISKNVITKGSTYYSKGAYNINGKKYHKLDAKGNIFVKDGNLKVRVITEQVTLKHNAYTYNIHGKRVGKRVLKKGDSYFIYRTKYINGKKFYQVGGSTYIKASNCGRPFSTVKKNNNDVNNTPTTNTNTNQTTTNANVGNAVNNSAVQNNNISSPQGGNNTQVNVGGNTNTNKPATNQPSQGGNNTQINVGGDTNTNKPATNQPSQGGNNTQVNVGGDTNTNKPATNQPSQGGDTNTNKPATNQPSDSNVDADIPTTPGTYTKSVDLLDENGNKLGTATLTRVVHADGSSDSKLSKNIPGGYKLSDPSILNNYPSRITLTKVTDQTQAGTTQKQVKLVDENGKYLGTGTAIRIVRADGSSTVMLKNMPNGYHLGDKRGLENYADQIMLIKGTGAITNKSNEKKAPVAPVSRDTKDISDTSSTPVVNYQNSIVFPKGYIQAVQASNFGVTPLTNKLSIEGNRMNKFYSESSADDNMKIDSDNLTPAQAREISLFALRLINQARDQVGAKHWLYSTRAQHIADRVAYLYEQDGMGLSTWHDQKALNKVDSESGVSTSELMGGSPVNYQEDTLSTMTDLKRAVYDDIASMLFSTVELHHAEGILTWNSKNPDSFCAMSVSWVAKNKQGKKEHSEHYIMY